MLSAMLFMSWMGTIIAICVHWLLMTVSLSFMESHEFCSSTNTIKFRRVNTLETLANVLFSAVLGLVYIFTYITPGKDKSLHRFLSINSGHSSIIICHLFAFRRRWHMLPLHLLLQCLSC